MLFYYSFYLPVALGMITEGITDRDIYNKAREIVILIGEFFQIQDDLTSKFSPGHYLIFEGSDEKARKTEYGEYGKFFKIENIFFENIKNTMLMINKKLHCQYLAK